MNRAHAVVAGLTLGYYLLDHPPASRQFYVTRRADPTGLLALHDTESLTDVNPPDTGAEAVAGFISRRSDPGSYHRLCDFDSTVPLMPFSYTAFQSRDGTNSVAVAIAGAYRLEQWADLPEWWRAGCVEQMALACLEAAVWLRTAFGIEVPPILLTGDQSRSGMPGFTTHSRLDPARRRDPGDDCAKRVINRFADLTSAPADEEDDMPPIRSASCKDSLGRVVLAVCTPENDVRVMFDGGPSLLIPDGKIVGDLRLEAGDDGKLTVSGLGGDGRYYASHDDGTDWGPWVAV